MMATAVGGTHPTGMHSCSGIKLNKHRQVRETHPYELTELTELSIIKLEVKRRCCAGYF